MWYARFGLWCEQTIYVIGASLSEPHIYRMGLNFCGFRGPHTIHE